MTETMGGGNPGESTVSRLTIETGQNSEKLQELQEI